MSDMYRIKRFDKYIKSMEGGLNIGNDVYAISSTKTENVDADLFDSIFNEYISGKVHVGLVFSYDMSNQSNVSMNIDSKDTLSWTFELDKSNNEVILDIEFNMTPDQRDAQLQTLKENNIEGCVIHLHDDKRSYIDFGELNSMCKIKIYLSLSELYSYSFRTEGIRFQSTVNESGYDDGFIHGLILVFGNKDSSNIGSMFFGIATPMTLFTEEMIESAKPFVDPTQVQINTNDDLKLSIEEPDGYCDWDGETPNSEYEVYRSIVIAKTKLKDTWLTIFSMPNNSELMEYVQAKDDQIVDGSLQIHYDEFVKWLQDTNKYDAFMDKFNTQLEVIQKSHEMNAEANHLMNLIKSEDTIRKIKEVRDHTALLTRKMMDVADDLGINMEDINDGVEIPNDLNNKFMDSIDNSSERAHMNDLIHELVLMIGLETELISETDTEMNVSELTQLSGYKYIHRNLDKIIEFY